MKHTPGPWTVKRLASAYYIHGSEKGAIGNILNRDKKKNPYAQEADAARIVECVNAFEGVADPKQAMLKIRRALDEVMAIADSKRLSYARTIHHVEEALSALGVELAVE
jgi:hypothetical protein